MRLADKREFDPTVVVPGVRYNIYDCPGPGREPGFHAELENLAALRAITMGATPVHSLLSADIDSGVTPMFVTCPDHQATASSRGYRVSVADVVAALPVRMVWRLATNGERKRERRQGGEHYARGGLSREWVP